jgi:5-methylcytosine-specific restriction endonuclease McrA
MSCLILNADAAPLSLLPLSIIDWQESIRYLVSEKAEVLEWYNDWIVRSERWSTHVPAVMILKEYQKKKTSIRFSKQNIFLRDEYRCQYCDISVTRNTATLDHVLPQSHGGSSVWENCTTACNSCNSKKGNNKKIIPKSKPWKPDYWALVAKKKKLGWEIQHSSWKNYLE